MQAKHALHSRSKRPGYPGPEIIVPRGDLTLVHGNEIQVNACIPGCRDCKTSQTAHSWCMETSLTSASPSSLVTAQLPLLASLVYDRPNGAFIDFFLDRWSFIRQSTLAQVDNNNFLSQS